ncbi:MAG: hypothetical protein ACI9T7_002710 [Oleiphilaceae bacterium]|jgi:hypothetical protein
MSWTFERIKTSLEEMMFDLDDVKSNSNGRVVKGNYLPLSKDINEVNRFASYLYGEDNVNADLIQFSASKGNKNYLSESELNFSALVKKVTSLLAVTNINLPDVFNLGSEDFLVGNYTLRVNNEENQCNAFIALSSSFEQAMEVRARHLYSTEEIT